MFRVEYRKDPFSVPLCFLYTYQWFVQCGPPIVFADDINLFYKGKDVNDMAQEINIELSQISLWLKTNKLSLNIKKDPLRVISWEKWWCDKNTNWW